VKKKRKRRKEKGRSELHISLLILAECRGGGELSLLAAHQFRDGRKKERKYIGRGGGGEKGNP